MTARQWRGARMIVLGVALFLLSTVVDEPMSLVFAVAGFVAIVAA